MAVGIETNGAVRQPANGSATAHIKSKQAPSTNASSNIIDIRSDTNEISIRNEISEGLRAKEGTQKTLPTLLLYDEAGLKLFEKITYLDEYYLTNAEIEVLETYADRMAERIQPNSIVVELGSGNLRKVNILLQALERKKLNVQYYALDLDLVELQRTLSAVPSYEYVKCFGLHGTYDDGLEWLQRADLSSKPKTVLSLGSSIGNFKRPDAGDFLAAFASILQQGDSVIIGIDSCHDAEKVLHAYNDRENVTHTFILNGLKHANRLLGSEAFVLDDWQVIGEYDVSGGRHHASVAPTKDVVIDGVVIKKDEKIHIEESHKYSRRDLTRLWTKAGLVKGATWTNSLGDYALHMVSKPTVNFALRPEQYAKHPTPTLDDFHGLWAAWDTVTRHMISDEELLEKPIKLRNACIFYLGHIPTFLDMHIARATGGEATEPREYPKIFERGIDPDVENPDHCHNHSEIPDDWPPVDQILEFQGKVRQRLIDLYANDKAMTDRKIGRSLWLAYEHEIMHLETLLYMLVQSDKTLPPPGVVKPDFEAISKAARINAVENEWFEIPEREITLGLDDPEHNDGPDRYFGWDNEKPSRTVRVEAFAAKGRGITNGEYATYLEKTKCDKLPASWFTQDAGLSNGTSSGTTNGTTNGAINGSANGHSTPSSSFLAGKAVRTVFGVVSLKDALEWPVVASYDELVGCAQWMGGRIPTLEETRSIYAHSEDLKALEIGKALGKTIPAVNSHLVNDGVQETPPQNGTSNGSSKTATLTPDPNSTFANLEGANVGFRHWHPTPITQTGNKLSGQSEQGGVWEWTSTVLEKHEGFEPMELYPPYTADFFDGKHNVVLGGSWATHPRIAGRKSFVNWYQRNYPYVWAGARLVRDI
ncbi:hypothetical protein K402DRAFT_324449 [Aulographum hederae CBS 113979]|uniref:N-methyltransferase n=1 Tax=Aulographum hederae CBS 113979 TaxID=1176131 RepID=A0A6G1HCI4_9PEZI|nr:hypothetical protein K402DRAFT_324449 [Aulographum hederae CBS 113979]